MANQHGIHNLSINQFPKDVHYVPLVLISLFANQDFVDLPWLEYAEWNVIFGLVKLLAELADSTMKGVFDPTFWRMQFYFFPIQHLLT